VPKALALIPSEPSAGCCSGRASGGSRDGGCNCCLSVTVLDDEAREGDDAGRGAAPSLFRACGDASDGDGDAQSSSGFAMRSPPRDCDRLRSPFIVAAGGQLGRETSER